MRFLPARLFRIMLSVVIIAILLSTTPSSAAAQTVTQDTQSSAAITAQNASMITQTVISELMSSAICQLIGIDTIHPNRSCALIGKQGSIGAVTTPDGARVAQVQPGGLLGSMGDLFAATYSLPIHTSDYTHTLAMNFGVVKPTYAAGDPGVGFGSLAPLVRMWEATRNLAYIILVIVFILVGVGVMLRVKIDPRTVMTVQNQIPKIIVTLILITFSYAIAGLLIDVMWTSSYVIVNTLSDAAGISAASATNGLRDNPISYFKTITSKDMGSFDGMSGLALNVGGNVGDIVAKTIIQMFGGQADLGDCGIGGLFGLGGGDFQSCIKKGIYGVLVFLITPIVTLIAFFALLVALFRVWFMLLKAYAYVIIYVIFSPLWILMGLSPGGALSFSSWIRSLFANLIVFPATAGLLLLAKIVVLLYQAPTATSGYNGFMPPLSGNPTLANGMGVLIAFGIVLLAPELLTIIRDALKTPQFKYSAAIGQGFAAGAAPVRVGLSRGWGRLTRPYDERRGPTPEDKQAGAIRRWAIEGKYNPLKGIGRSLLGSAKGH